MMKPTWESADGRVRLFNADCLEILPTLHGVDAVVTDPPYGIKFNAAGRRKHVSPSSIKSSGGNYGKDWGFIHGDDKSFDPSPFMKFKDKILWGANHYADKLPPSGGWLIWDKKRFGTAGQGFHQSDAELAWTNVLGVVKVKSIYWDGFRRDVEVNQHYHPTQKPVELMEWCIKFSSKSKTIFDPYLGSGTTGVAAIRLGRSFIGCEIDPVHFETAVDRISRAIFDKANELPLEMPEEPQQDDIFDMAGNQ